jgi:O-antigen/teichoic acid export membrane protein
MASDRPAGFLRARVARGVMVNSAFTIALQSLGLARGFAVAAFLSRRDYGLWGVLIVGLLTVGWLRQVGVSDRYLQQDEPDQERAFQEAFSAELLAALAFTLIFAVTVPILALVYGEQDLLAPGLVMALALPATAFQAGIWVFYRNMDFLRQRLLAAVDPVVGAAVAIALAASGAGTWAFIGGMLAGTWGAAAMAVWASPYRLRLRLRRRSLLPYVKFSWPLMVGAGASAAMIQGTVLTTHAVLGLAGVGTIALAASVSAYGERVDELLTASLYPAICAMKDRLDLLFESFEKANRVALMWAAPYGAGLALFAPYLADLGLGHRWDSALGLVQAYGVIAAFNHVAFNWGSYYMARAETRPIAVVKGVIAATFLACAIPLIVTDGLTGLAIGLAITTAVSLALRGHYVRRLFPAFRLRRQIARGFAPTLPAVALALAVRFGGEAAGLRTPVRAVLELVVYLAVTAAATFVLERRLVREMLGYLRAGRAGAGGLSPRPVSEPAA